MAAVPKTNPPVAEHIEEKPKIESLDDIIAKTATPIVENKIIKPLEEKVVEVKQEITKPVTNLVLTDEENDDDDFFDDFFDN